MTFLEAAIEVLKREGKPCHFKDLTRLAQKFNLLSVVGREPEQTMQARLTEAAKRDSAELVQVSPGVFGLRSYPQPTRSATPDGAPRSGAVSDQGRRPAQRHAMPVKKDKKEPSAEQPAAPPRRRAPVKRRADEAEEAGSAGAEAGSAGAAETAQTGAAEEPGPGDGRRRRGRAHAPGTRVERLTLQEAQAETPPVATAQPPAPPQEQPVVTRQQELPLKPAEVPQETKAEQEPVVEEQAPAAQQPPAAEPAPAAQGPAVEQAAPVASQATPAAQQPAPAVQATPAAPQPAPAISSVLLPAGGDSGQAAASGPPAAQQRPDQKQRAEKQEPAEPAARILAMQDAVADVLRGSSDGRPVHLKQIVDIGLKRRLVRGEAVDLYRMVRAAVVRDQRQRDQDGLRTRIRHLGQGSFGLVDRKLEPELQTAERELLDRLSRTREATRVALRRRLRGLPPSAFELLMRLLLEKLGMLAPELFKRGDNVAYYSGSLPKGCRNVKLLVAVRPGESEITREAVGELRAGVKLRGYEEGLMLCSARANSAAVAEVAAAPGIDLYDQDALTDLLIRHQIGVRRMSLPIEYLDIDLFGELLEPV